MSTPLRSGLGRGFDLSLPSNVFILTAAPVSGVAWAVWKMATEGDIWQALIRAVVAGGITFLAWALVRELDPDRPWTAGAAAVGASAVIGMGVPSLLVTSAVLLASRIVVRTTGLRPGIGDLVFVGGLAVAAGASDTGPAAALVLAAAMAAEAVLPGKRPRWVVPMGIGAAALAVALAFMWGDPTPGPGLPSGPEWGVAPITAIGLLGLFRSGRVESVGDVTGKPLSPVRVVLGRVAAAAAGALTFVWAAGPGLTAASAVWVALAVSALPSRPRND